LANIRTVISGEKAAMSTISTVALGETDVLRRSGLEIVGDVPWGTHFCQFYETADDLIDILVPYFKAGLENNEFCMWVTSELLSREEAENAMRKAVPDFDRFLKRGQMEIVSYGEWYLKDGVFDLKRVLDGWIGKLDEALAKGYDGIRVTGNTAWLEKKDWKDFADYEEKVNSVIGKYRMIAICTYSISKCGASEVIDVIRNHQFALIRREGKWELIESSEIKQAKEALRASEEKFRRIYEGASDAMVYLDKSGKILDVNKKAVELFGGSKEELLGKHFAKVGVISAREVSTLMKAFAKVLAGKQVTADMCVKNRKGREICLECSASLMKIHDRHAILLLARDITERKRTEEELIRLSSAVKMSTDSIVIGDLDAKIIAVNEAVLKMYGTDDKMDLIGRNSFDLIVPEEREKALAGMKEVLEKGYHKGLEYHVITKNGARIPVEMSVALMKDADGKPIGFVSISRDITERKKTEQAIRESQQKFERLFRSNPEAAVYWDKDFRIVDINQRFSELFGYSLDEIKGKKTDDIIVPEDKMEESKLLGKKSKEGYVYHDTVRMRKDRSLVPVSISVSPIIVESQVIGYIGLYKDITDRKQAEEALRESEEKYRNLFENAREVIITFDLKGNITSINKIVEEYGFKRDEMIEKNMLKFVSKKYWPKLLRQLADLIRGNKVEGEIEILTPVGKRIAEYRSNPIMKNEKVVGLQTIMRDITERIKLEDSLRESEEKYRNLVENTKDSIVIIDLKGNVLFGNKATEELTGYTPKNGVRMNVRQITPLKYWPKSLEMLLKAKQGKRIPYFESMIKRKDGTLIPVESGGQAIFKNGKVVGVQIITRNITERKKMEEKLRQYSEHLEELVQKRTEELLESEKRYSVLVEEASDGVAIIQDGKIIFANKKALEIVGYSRDEQRKVPFEMLVDEKYRQHINKLYMKTLRGEEVPTTSELELIAKTGEHVPIEVTGTLINYQGRLAVLIIIRDIRERKRMEEQRLRLEKLETMSELATMVAHDLRNPLTSIRNACFYIKNTCPARANVECKSSLEMLEIIEKETLAASSIVNDLLDFAARRPLQKKEQNINNLIDDSLKRIHTPENIRVERKYAKKAIAAIDEKQLERVIINLTKNAVQAMPNDGTLTITTKETKDHVEIAFTDTGTGIQEENMNKLFTPLFTTKAKGIGMGLAICKKIVEQHGGTIEAQSKAGQGTTFTIKLPKKQEENTQ